MNPDDFRTARRSLGMTWKQLAERLGVNWRTVARWEAGHSPVSPTAARLMAEWLERA